MMPTCLTFALLFSSLNLTSVPVPGFNESFLGAHAFNLTCTSVAFESTNVDWQTNASIAASTNGGTLHCHANLTAYAYSGLAYADVVVDPSSVVLTRGSVLDSHKKPEGCLHGPYNISTCAVQASVTRLYAEPPSVLIDMVLQKMRASVNEHLSSYVCDVWVPQVVKNMMDPWDPVPDDRNTSDGRVVYPLSHSPLVQSAIRVLKNILWPANVASGGSYGSMLSDEEGTIFFPLPKPFSRALDAVVAANANESAMEWLQSVVDDILAEEMRDPFPVYGFPGKVNELAVNFTPDVRVWGERDLGYVRVAATLASCEENTCEVYLQPGVEVTQFAPAPFDSAGVFVRQTLMPFLLPVVNAKIAAAMAALAESQHRNLSDPLATVTVSFGKKAVWRQSPTLWPLVGIVLGAIGSGAWMVRRNLRRHAEQPVLDLASGESVTAVRLACEDAVMLVGATLCLLLFAASNTMTGASVLLGGELNTYSFSLWNTVTDLWRAGLVPLSVCVFIFSGVYPYVKLLSLVYFTVYAQRPRSRRLAVIDVLGKFSFIDTFALMVMVSGLEIRGVAQVIIHASFYFFMFATVASIALGNYATNLYRRGTSHCLAEEDVVPYDVVNTQDSTATTTTSSDGNRRADANAQNTTEAAATGIATAEGDGQSCFTSLWRHLASRTSVLPFVVVHLCLLPAWANGCLQYDIGGLARLITPVQKTLSLWQLSLLNKWGSVSLHDDFMVVFIFLVAFFTLLLAPCLYSLFHKRAAFLASWCATDVFVVACVAGLLQLHQFITFVLGDGMDDVYTAHATLRWPMIPLTIASLVIWYFIVREIAGVTWKFAAPTATSASA